MMKNIDETVSSMRESGQLADSVQLILTNFGPELRGYLRGALRDAEEGDDVFQELSVAVWKRLPMFRFESSLRTWCYAIAHHLVLKRLKRYSRRNGVRLDTGRQDGLAAPSMTSLVEHQEQAMAAARAAAQLTPAEREILILRAERGLSYEEVAMILSLPSAESARQRFHRTKEKLKSLLSTLADSGNA